MVLDYDKDSAGKNIPLAVSNGSIEQIQHFEMFRNCRYMLLICRTIEKSGTQFFQLKNNIQKEYLEYSALLRA